MNFILRSKFLEYLLAQIINTSLKIQSNKYFVLSTMGSIVFLLTF